MSHLSVLIVFSLHTMLAVDKKFDKLTAPNETIAIYYVIHQITSSYQMVHQTPSIT